MTITKDGLKLVTLAMTIALLTGCGGGSGGDSHERYTAGAANAGEARRTVAASEATRGSDNTSAADETWTSEPGPTTGAARKATALSWIAPVSRLDGTAFSLSQLRGYVLSIGDESRVYDRTIELDALTDEYSLRGLEPGHYYVALQARDVDDRLSPYSDELLIAVN